MTTKQMSVIYSVMLTVFFVLVLGASHVLDKPMSTEDYADRLCQEMYGPQTGHKWVEGSLFCETARGELLKIRKQ
jgi:hypothetical protein